MIISIRESILAIIFLSIISPVLQAEMIEKDIDLPNCILHVHMTNHEVTEEKPLFVMMEGVPLSGKIYYKLANELVDKMNAQSILIDFPGVGSSEIKNEDYSWDKQRECLRSYLVTLPAHILVVSDLALPVAAPLTLEPLDINGLIVANSVVKPSETKPPFPMSFFRCCPGMALAVSAITPRFILETRINSLGIGRPESVDKEEIRELYNEMKRNGFKRLALIMTAIDLDEKTDQEIIDGLAAPLPQLFLWGGADPVLGKQHEKLQPLSKNQKLIIYEEARHFPMLDYYGEMANDISEWYSNQFN